jgi:hypothetical protein
LRVPLEKLKIRDEYAVSVAAGEEVVCVRHVYHGTALDAVFVACVEADVVLDIEFPQTLVFLEWKAQEVPEGESILVVGVNVEVGVDDPGRGVLEYRVWYGVVQAGPMSEGVGPDVGAEKVLAMDGGGDVGENGLDVAFHCVLPLLIWGGAFMAALIVLVKLVGFG